MTRTFEDKVATRERVPLLVGLMGPSGGGKTYSALRLATGMQRVSGGDIHVIDTEAKRSLHYADRFKFRHIKFGAPFGPLDYLAAIEHCVSKGAGVVIVDSMSHEHEGPGGVLEMHEAETEKLAKQWNQRRDKVQMSAWSEPKKQRRRLINSIMQMETNFIFCFRAKNKLKIVPGKAPEARGFMPIAGEEFVFEMMACGLLMPGAGGVPSWHPEGEGEKQMVKMPEQFIDMFKQSRPLDEEQGRQMALWAAGDSAAPTVEEFEAKLGAILAAPSKSELSKIKRALTAKAWGNDQRDALRRAMSDREEQLKELDSQPESDPADAIT